MFSSNSISDALGCPLLERDPPLLPGTMKSGLARDESPVDEDGAKEFPLPPGTAGIISLLSPLEEEAN